VPFEGQRAHVEEEITVLFSGHKTSRVQLASPTCTRTLIATSGVTVSCSSLSLANLREEVGKLSSGKSGLSANTGTRYIYLKRLLLWEDR